MRHILKYKLLDSTMNEAKRLLEDTSKLNELSSGKLILIQGLEQSLGRGQYGKAWASPPGAGFYLSFLSSKAIPSYEEASIKATELVIDLLTKFFETRNILLEDKFTLKPINDIYYRGQKLAGILVETFKHQEQLFNIIGIGLNLYSSNYRLKESLLDAPKASPIALDEIVSREELMKYEEELLFEIYDSFRDLYFS
ncbi:MAG: hypothetical protein MK033_03005 [Candidatus Caenarcaniphilales bacterium]|nr:hypothetical protein [Candidatus Caenarcaniphilales bacterium]